MHCCWCGQMAAILSECCTQQKARSLGGRAARRQSRRLASDRPRPNFLDRRCRLDRRFSQESEPYSHTHTASKLSLRAEQLASRRGSAKQSRSPNTKRRQQLRPPLLPERLVPGLARFPRLRFQDSSFPRLPCMQSQCQLIHVPIVKSAETRGARTTIPCCLRKTDVQKHCTKEKMDSRIMSVFQTREAALTGLLIRAGHAPRFN
jgi:hypothetical protein